jgi:hypothetical protein
MSTLPSEQLLGVAVIVALAELLLALKSPETAIDPLSGHVYVPEMVQFEPLQVTRSGLTVLASLFLWRPTRMWSLLLMPSGTAGLLSALARALLKSFEIEVPTCWA